MFSPNLLAGLLSFLAIYLLHKIRKMIHLPTISNQTFVYINCMFGVVFLFDMALDTYLLYRAFVPSQKLEIRELGIARFVLFVMFSVVFIFVFPFWEKYANCTKSTYSIRAVDCCSCCAQDMKLNLFAVLMDT
jgi:hypothetical protein